MSVPLPSLKPKWSLHSPWDLVLHGVVPPPNLLSLSASILQGIGALGTFSEVVSTTPNDATLPLESRIFC